MAIWKIPRSVLVVIYTPALDVLLIERAKNPGFWQSVTGSVDTPDEPPRECAWREVLEETGIDSGPGSSLAASLTDWNLENVYEIYPAWKHRYAPDVTNNTEHVFGLQVPEQLPVKLAPLEHIDYRWMPYREAADACFSPSNAEAILLLPEFIS